MSRDVISRGKKADHGRCPVYKIRLGLSGLPRDFRKILIASSSGINDRPAGEHHQVLSVWDCFMCGFKEVMACHSDG